MKRNEQYDAEIRFLVETYPLNYARMLCSKGKTNGRNNNHQDRTHLYEYIMSMTPMLDDREFKYTFKTRVYWVLNKIESWDDERVRCKNDGKPIKHWNVSGITDPYKTSCCYECERALAAQTSKTSLQKLYGVTNVFCRSDVLEKIASKREHIKKKAAATKKERYGDPFYNNSKKAAQTKIDRYGSVWNQVAIEKTNLARYGIAHWNNPTKNFATKKRNGTLTTSKPENQVYELLCQKYGKNDVIRQHKTELYPFACDFYIVSADTYIECNFGWTHGGHWYDSHNADDNARVESWMSRGTQYYKNAVHTWTVRDVSKRMTAEKNGLNYIVFWSLEEAVEWIEKN